MSPFTSVTTHTPGFDMAKIGYIRAADEVLIHTQETELSAAGCDKIFTDKVGLREPRPEWDLLLEYIGPGDMVVVAELSSMAHTVKQFYKLIRDFNKSGIGVISLGDNINTTESGNCFFTAVRALEKLEKVLKIEGEKAKVPPKRRGKSTGRPPLPNEIMEKAAQVFRSGGKTADEVAKEFNISRRVLFKFLKGIKESTPKGRRTR